ncbi:MAG: energy-coupling factor ABC transporter ATP-binding protein [Holophagales bacterium]|nr:energy-coupling factor ABC transporter ATP-binding protein [Holophagales bacterium]
MLKVTNLSVKYDLSDEYALKGVEFTVQSGERVAVIGANGAGKSTLLLVLTGVLSHDSGGIVIDDIVLEKKTMLELRKKLGMIFQNPDDQLFMPTVYEDIAFGPRNYGSPEAETEAKADEALSQLNISHLKRRLSHKLSGGEKRLVALASVLVMKPVLLLLDEPTSFLDPKARRRLIGVLDALPQTMIIATHDLDMALDLCGRVILLKEGHIHTDAPVNDALHNADLLEECGLELPLSLQKR